MLVTWAPLSYSSVDDAVWWQILHLGQLVKVDLKQAYYTFGTNTFWRLHGREVHMWIEVCQLG